MKPGSRRKADPGIPHDPGAIESIPRPPHPVRGHGPIRCAMADAGTRAEGCCRYREAVEGVEAAQ